jgi:hypothetical protein
MDKRPKAAGSCVMIKKKDDFMATVNGQQVNPQNPGEVI